MNSAPIVFIKRLAVHDGPGIRTTLFLKGCSLKCQWCHNPETISPHLMLEFKADNCTFCKRCAEHCGNHIIKNNVHLLDRAQCTVCGECVNLCIYDALNVCGEMMSAKQASEEILEDIDFYRISGGGITLSGGEPLLYADFCLELFKLLKSESIHCAIDTCGNVTWDSFAKVIPYTDLFLYDIKHVNSKIHRKVTGAGNKLILDNLRRLDQACKAVEVRMPIIPGINDSVEVITATGEFLSQLTNINNVKLLPYNSYAGSKYSSIGLTYHMPELTSPSKENIISTAELLRSFDLKVQLPY